MGLIVKDTGAVPKEGWQYFVKATNFTVRVPNYGLLHDAVVKHCSVNQVSVPSEQAVIDWVCQNLTVSCVEMTTRQPLINRFILSFPRQTQSCCGSG